MVGDHHVYRKLMSSIGPVVGIYRLQVLAKDRLSFVPLKRIVSTDPQGILYIGASRSLPDRIGNLRRALDAAYEVGNYKNADAHPCGTKLKRNDKLRSMFSFDDLCVTIPVYDERNDNFDRVNGHYNLEWCHLRKYSMDYGDFPPLNG
jgi:hypothetical protein